ncbi:uncharacterized protein LOC126376840 [Pectinophora gossypiella]|uniref:uncharacterized protein LOC126376840 n=1 Tax=Pectinophora gossypiella TaxID=13191 RepID=UPI00214E0632|nr:uncharacterized protein LOC126376840 [Pectinophora gossypiella]
MVHTLTTAAYKMKVLIILLITVLALHVASSAPSRLHDLEQAMMNQLHRPWHESRPTSEHPRKGEGCKGGRCKVQEGCEGCQYAVPIQFNNFEEFNSNNYKN